MKKKNKYLIIGLIVFLMLATFYYFKIFPFSMWAREPGQCSVSGTNILGEGTYSPPYQFTCNNNFCIVSHSAGGWVMDKVLENGERYLVYTTNIRFDYYNCPDYKITTTYLGCDNKQKSYKDYYEQSGFWESNYIIFNNYSNIRYEPVECCVNSDCNLGGSCQDFKCTYPQTTTSTTITTIPKPTLESLMPDWNMIISKIIDWLKSIFSFLKFEIYGEQYPTVGSMQTYTINITTTPPDSDYSDGSYQVQYGSWALIDNNGNIINKGSWEEVSGNYYKQVSLTIPSSPNNYVLVGLIYQYDMKYNSSTMKWEIVNQQVIQKEAMNLNARVIAPQKPPAPSFADIINSIINWLKGLFSWLFGGK
jgi:hypothetical protein